MARILLTAMLIATPKAKNLVTNCYAYKDPVGPVSGLEKMHRASLKIVLAAHYPQTV